MIKFSSKFSISDRRKFLSQLLCRDGTYVLMVTVCVQCLFNVHFISNKSSKRMLGMDEGQPELFTRDDPKKCHWCLFTSYFYEDLDKIANTDERYLPFKNTKELLEISFQISTKCMWLRLRLQQMHIILEHGRTFANKSKLEEMCVSRFVQLVNSFDSHLLCVNGKIGNQPARLSEKGACQGRCQRAQFIPAQKRGIHAKFDKCLLYPS